MKLPIQSQPVMRTLGITVGVYANNGIIPSGDNCGTGSWCCNVGGKSSCYNCSVVVPFTGNCLQTADTVCSLYGGTPSTECHM